MLATVTTMAARWCLVVALYGGRDRIRIWFLDFFCGEAHLMTRLAQRGSDKAGSATSSNVDSGDLSAWRGYCWNDNEVRNLVVESIWGER